MPESEALDISFREVRREIRETGCTRAVLVGHNSFFDLAFPERGGGTRQDRNPFHPFSSFDTVSLAGLAYGQTRCSARRCGRRTFPNEREAHSAIYDAERTAELFCRIVNRWRDMEVGANGRLGVVDAFIWRCNGASTNFLVPFACVPA